MSRPPPGRVGNVKCFLGTFLVGAPVTGAVRERPFLPNLDSLDPVARRTGGSGSARFTTISVVQFEFGKWDYLPTSRATALGAIP